MVRLTDLANQIGLAGRGSEASPRLSLIQACDSRVIRGHPVLLYQAYIDHASGLYRQKWLAPFLLAGPLSPGFASRIPREGR